MKTPTAALATAAALVTIALTGAAFWLSYEHLHDIASAHGLSGARAWAWPATIDLFIVAGELLVLRASLRGAVDHWAYALAAVGSIGSIALNVFGVGDGAQPMEYVVAAVPPTAALVAFGALMRQVHEALHRIQAAATPTAEPVQPDAADDFERAAHQAVTVAEPDAPSALILDFHPQPQLHPEVCASASAAAQPTDAPTPQPSKKAAAAAPVVRELPGPEADAALLEAALAINAAALAETGRPASLRRLQSELRIGQRRAQRIQAQLPRSA